MYALLFYATFSFHTRLLFSIISLSLWTCDMIKFSRRNSFPHKMHTSTMQLSIIQTKFENPYTIREKLPYWTHRLISALNVCTVLILHTFNISFLFAITFLSRLCQSCPVSLVVTFVKCPTYLSYHHLSYHPKSPPIIIIDVQKLYSKFLLKTHDFLQKKHAALSCIITHFCRSRIPDAITMSCNITSLIITVLLLYPLVSSPPPL